MASPDDHPDIYFADCNICDKSNVACCNDGVCRECHKSISFDECISGAWVKRQREGGLREPLSAAFAMPDLMQVG